MLQIRATDKIRLSFSDAMTSARTRRRSFGLQEKIYIRRNSDMALVSLEDANLYHESLPGYDADRLFAEHGKVARVGRVCGFCGCTGVGGTRRCCDDGHAEDQASPAPKLDARDLHLIVHALRNNASSDRTIALQFVGTNLRMQDQFEKQAAAQDALADRLEDF